ncbi:TonB-dependent receptor [Sphingobium sp. Sx8-8]|uniref:TonB-dependent receptor n=1 Tax=Sphingobium sp. Sx8-8 TaxID=2933617 RepID=UPI001F57E34C|nr:TonB-dependent receptor [Sphingobium sp. Sx8-8]
MGFHIKSASAGRDFLLRGVCGFALVLALAVPAHAQSAADASDPAASNARDTTRLEEIVVTAQRRGQNLQDVPVAVTAFNSNTLAQSGVASVRELGQLDSSLNLNQGSGTIVPFLRGVGNPSGTTNGNEASVPVYIDDVYYTRLAPIDLELANVERVEVLKGPQGTLFGRNASGGAIQVFTRDPGSEMEFQGKLGYANYDTVSGQIYFSTPITDRVGFNVSASGLHQGDGWGKNLTSGQETYKNKFFNVRGKFVGDLTDTTTIHLAAFYNRQRTGQGVTNGLYQGRLNGTPPLPSYGPTQQIPAPPFYDSIATKNNFINHRGWGVSLKIQQDLDFADLVSISAIRKATELYYTDGENLPFNFLAYDLHSYDRQISQELQLKSRSGSSFDWIVGGFYLNSKQGYVPSHITGDALTASGIEAQDLYGLQTVNSLSGYGQATFHVVPEGTNITLGLRYTSDKVHGVGHQTLIFPGGTTFPLPGGEYDKEFTFNKLTYKVALDHKFGRNVMGYVSFSRGYKSGTFNTLPLASDPSRPETVQAYEIGLKSELFDRKLRINAAIFQNDIQNPQVVTVFRSCTPPGSNNCVNSVGLTNAEKARTRGVELDSSAVVADGLTIQAGFVYLDAKYVDFANAPFYFPNPNPPYGNLPPVLGDASGNRLSQVPKWRLHGGFDYVWDASFGKVTFNANAAYTDSFYWDADNILKQGAYTIVNGSIAFSPSADDRFTVTLWAKNLAGEKYYGTQLTLAGFAGNIASPAPPRTYGIDVGFKF